MKPEPRPNARRFPWLPLILLIVTIAAFWIVPREWPKRPIQVEFESANSKTAP